VWWPAGCGFPILTKTNEVSPRLLLALILSLLGILSMDMSAAPNARTKADRKAGQRARIEDLPVLLASLAEQQATSMTALRVREGNPPDLTGDEAARMATIFAPAEVSPAPPKGAAGSFNAGVATRLTMGKDGEGGVYSGT
jgi:hypothetical protein